MRARTRIAAAVLVVVAGTAASAGIAWVKHGPEVVRTGRGTIAWHLRITSPAIRGCPVMRPDGPVVYESSLGRFVDHGEDPADVRPRQSVDYWSTAPRAELDAALEAWALARGGLVLGSARTASFTALELRLGTSTLRFDTYESDGRTHVHASETR